MADRRGLWTGSKVAVGAVVLIAAVGILLGVVRAGDAQAVPTVSADQSWSHVGQNATVRFIVQSTSVQGGSELLNALGRDSYEYGFSAVLSDSVVRTATYDPADYDFGHAVSVKGIIRIVQRQPAILVRTLTRSLRSTLCLDRATLAGVWGHPR